MLYKATSAQSPDSPDGQNRDEHCQDTQVIPMVGDSHASVQDVSQMETQRDVAESSHTRRKKDKENKKQMAHDDDDDAEDVKEQKKDKKQKADRTPSTTAAAPRDKFAGLSAAEAANRRAQSV